MWCTGIDFCKFKGYFKYYNKKIFSTVKSSQICQELTITYLLMCKTYFVGDPLSNLNSKFKIFNDYDLLKSLMDKNFQKSNIDITQSFFEGNDSFEQFKNLILLSKLKPSQWDFENFPESITLNNDVNVLTDLYNFENINYTVNLTHAELDCVMETILVFKNRDITEWNLYGLESISELKKKWITNNNFKYSVLSKNIELINNVQIGTWKIEIVDPNYNYYFTEGFRSFQHFLYKLNNNGYTFIEKNENMISPEESIMKPLYTEPSVSTIVANYLCDGEFEDNEDSKSCYMQEYISDLAINKKVEISNSKNDKKILILEKLKNNYFDIVKERDEILYENENLKNDVEMRKTKEKGNINQQVQVAFEPNFNCKNCITLKNNLNSVANRLSQFICSNKNLKNKMSVLEMSQLKEKSKICEIEEQHYYINNLEEKNKKLKDSSIFLRKEISCILNMINNEKCYNIAQNKSENVQKASMLIRQNNSMKNHVDRIIQPQFNYSFKPNHINRKKYKFKEKSKKYFIQDGQVLDMKKKFPLEKNKKYISKIRELMAAQYMVNVLSIEKSNCVITQNEQRKLINQLERKNNTIEKSTQIMKKRLMRISTINEQLNTKIMTYTFMESDYKILKNSESDKSEKLNQLIVYNNNNRKELQSLRVELMKYHELCKTMNLDMMSLHSACKNQQMELIVKRNSIKTFIDNDKNMRNEIVNLKNDLTQFKNTYRNSKTVQFQLNQTVNSLKSQISAYVEQNQNSNNAIDQLTDSIDEHKLTIQQNERNISLMENRQQYLLYKTDQNMNKIISSYKNILELQNKKVTNCSSRILKYRNFLMTLTNMLCEKNIEKTESIVDSGNDTDLEQTYISEAKVKASKILNMDKHLMESICTISNYKQKELINKEFKVILQLLNIYKFNYFIGF
ncbi:hypothetical protein A3Q56_04761 [Intoshia linei]|uniref:Uncharacterized protein n=1 Tax=Intoshia linei TaxID=1819745 RepID=A0A177B169_9BILA|nr:hypothetical protein A3Q56_04761 [Intoshia linei]